MKKALALFLALLMCLPLTACGGGNDNQPTNAPANQGNTPVAEEGTADNKTEGIPGVDDAKVLKEGVCGDNASFKLYDNGVLVVSGSGSVSGENPFDTYGDYIKYIRIDEGITDIADHAFRDIDSYSTVELPSTLKTIGRYAFAECIGLETINFPEGLESIGENAFYITRLQSIVLPSTISEIAEGTFSYNDKLEIIIIPGNVKTIGKGAFQDCDKLATIILCEGVETIEDEAFDAKGMRKMAIPDSVTSIGWDNLDYRTKIYCNDDAPVVELASGNNWEIDTITGYDGFVRNYDLP